MNEFDSVTNIRNAQIANKCDKLERLTVTEISILG